MFFVFLRNVRAPTLQSVKIICMQSFFVLHNNFLAGQTGCAGHSTVCCLWTILRPELRHSSDATFNQEFFIVRTELRKEREIVPTNFPLANTSWQKSSFTPWFSNKSIISTWKMGYEQCICLVNCKEFYVFIVQTPSFTTVFGTYPALHVSLKLSLRVEFNK